MRFGLYLTGLCIGAVGVGSWLVLMKNAPIGQVAAICGIAIVLESLLFLGLRGAK